MKEMLALAGLVIGMSMPLVNSASAAPCIVCDANGCHIENPCPDRPRGPEGATCGFASITDPTGEGDVQTGEIDGGPLVAASTDPDAPSADPTASLTLKCTIQVGPTGATHAGADAASASANGTGVVVLPPTQVSYVSPEGLDVYLCTEVTVNGTTYYWDDVNGAWSTSNGAACGIAISQEVDPDEGPIHDLEILVDSIICPVLAVVLPPEGDIVLPDPIGKIWDCPPYDA